MFLCSRDLTTAVSSHVIIIIHNVLCTYYIGTAAARHLRGVFIIIRSFIIFFPPFTTTYHRFLSRICSNKKQINTESFVILSLLVLLLLLLGILAGRARGV